MGLVILGCVLQSRKPHKGVLNADVAALRGEELVAEVYCVCDGDPHE